MSVNMPIIGNRNGEVSKLYSIKKIVEESCLQNF
jgi:hypothetical protein